MKAAAVVVVAAAAAEVEAAGPERAAAADSPRVADCCPRLLRRTLSDWLPSALPAKPYREV
jgi:hypothetical protein